MKRVRPALRGARPPSPKPASSSRCTIPGSSPPAWSSPRGPPASRSTSRPDARSAGEETGGRWRVGSLAMGALAWAAAFCGTHAVGLGAAGLAEGDACLRVGPVARWPGGPVARWPGGRGQAHGDGDARCVDVCWWARWSRRAWRPGCRWPRVRCRRGPALGVPVGRDGRHARRLSRCAHRGVPLLAKEAPEALVDGGVDQWAGSARRAWRRRRRAAGGVEIAPAMTGGRMLGRAVDNMSSRTPWWKAWADGPWPNTRWTGRAPGPWRAGRPKRCCVATPANPCLRPGARRCRR